MNKYLKLALCAYPLFALADNENKDEIKSQRFIYGGGVYGAYLFSVSDSVSLGVYGGGMYHSTAKAVATLGVIARSNVDFGMVSGVRLMVGALGWLNHKGISADKLEGDLKKDAEAYNKEKNGMFRGAYGLVAVEFNYVAAGLIFEYSERSALSKGCSFGVVVLPNYVVSENVEVGAIIFGSGAIHGKDEKGEVKAKAEAYQKAVKALEAEANKNYSEDEKAKFQAKSDAMKALKDAYVAKANYSQQEKKEATAATESNS